MIAGFSVSVPVNAHLPSDSASTKIIFSEIILIRRFVGLRQRFLCLASAKGAVNVAHPLPLKDAYMKNFFILLAAVIRIIENDPAWRAVALFLFLCALGAIYGKGH